MVVIMVTYMYIYIFQNDQVHFENYLRYIVYYGFIYCSIIMVIMKGIARVIDKSTRYFWINLVSVQILNIVLSIETLTMSGQGQLVITKSVVNLYYFKIAR